MKRAAFILFLVPALLFATSFSAPLEEIAHAERGAVSGRAAGGFRSGGGFRGGSSFRAGGGFRSGGFRDGGFRGGHFRGGGGHFRGGVFIGDPWFWDPFYYPFYPYYAYPYPYYPYYSEPVVIEQEPDVYVTPAPQQEQQSYWYYCRESKGYYPYVKRCPGGWMKVVPNATPPEDLQQ